MYIIKVLDKLSSAFLLLLFLSLILTVKIKSVYYFINYCKYVQLTKLPGLIKDHGLSNLNIFFHSFCYRRLDNPIAHLLYL